MNMQTECTVEIEGHTVRIRRYTYDGREWIAANGGTPGGCYQSSWWSMSTFVVVLSVEVKSNDSLHEPAAMVLAIKEWRLENVETAGLDGFSTLEEKVEFDAMLAAETP